jgi:hypothetical protein
MDSSIVSVFRWMGSFGRGRRGCDRREEVDEGGEEESGGEFDATGAAEEEEEERIARTYGEYG